ncbi:MAG: transporter related [Paenibacillus sp.]|nr:transporter related [Paenibacillus sp.]
MLSIKSLHVSYGAVQAIKGIDMELARGEVVCVIGSNGAGKSSLLHAVIGMVKPTSGNITFEEKDMTYVSASRTSNMGISLVPEGREVFGTLTVLDNLRMGLKRRIGSISKAEWARELDAAFERFPRLYERRDQLAFTLSGGEQQMLVLSRALVSKPKLLLLDEPSLGLAPIIVNDLFAVIRQLADDGIAVLLVEQMAHKALSISDRGYVIDKGMVSFQGEADILMNDQRIIEAYLGAH